MKNIFNHLLAVLCMADLVFILSNLVLAPSSLGEEMNGIVFKTAQCVGQVSLTFKRIWLLKTFYCVELIVSAFMASSATSVHM